MHDYVAQNPSVLENSSETFKVAAMLSLRYNSHNFQIQLKRDTS